MNTPICDFVKKYIDKNPLRLHMPGHKGKSFTGCESCDITEIDGADSLYDTSGIIMESEKYASELFGCDTFYSAEGSSQCIKAMIYLAGLYAQKINRKKLIFALRNVHKSFVSAVSLSDFDVKWIYSEDDDSYLSCRVNAQTIEKSLKEAPELPVAVYVTSPDYLGNIQDIREISQVCRKYGVLLLCDNAHGAYLKFLSPSLHPMDLGADMCCDSAHKTLPALTGAAYLHISDSIRDSLSPCAKNALSLFGSTSPNYLILQSLDYLNIYLCDGYKEKLNEFVYKSDKLKSQLKNAGYTLCGDEPLKITVFSSHYGYSGWDMAEIFEKNGVVCEFCDENFLVMMITPELTDDDIAKVLGIFENIERKDAITSISESIRPASKEMSIRQAVMSLSEEIPLDKASGRVLSQLTVACPPAVLVVSPGEVIKDEHIEIYKKLGTKTLWVVK